MTRLTYAKQQPGPYMPASVNYHLALSEYVHDALKRQGLQVTREHDIYVRVRQAAGATSLVIDCLDGGIYSDDRRQPRLLGRLRGFGRGQRWSDAYRCAQGSVNTVLGCVERHLSVTAAPEELEVLVPIIDLRDVLDDTGAGPGPVADDVVHDTRDEDDVVIEWLRDLRDEDVPLVRETQASRVVHVVPHPRGLTLWRRLHHVLHRMTNWIR